MLLLGTLLIFALGYATRVYALRMNARSPFPVNIRSDDSDLGMISENGRITCDTHTERLESLRFEAASQPNHEGAYQNMKSRLTRRDFCKLTAAAAGVTMVPSADFVAAADDAPREVMHDFTVRSVTPKTWPDGAVKKGGMILVNDSLPGPTIRAREGDTVVVRLRNDLSEGTTIHWHGMTQLGTWQMDGVANVSQEPIPPGETFEYRFKAEPAGTHLWHSHTGVQYGEGMFGMLIVDAVDDPYRGDYDAEHIVCINDWFHEPGTQILSNLEKGVYMEPMKMGGGRWMGRGRRRRLIRTPVPTWATCRISPP